MTIHPRQRPPRGSHLQITENLERLGLFAGACVAVSQTSQYFRNRIFNLPGLLKLFDRFAS